MAFLKSLYQRVSDTLKEGNNEDQSRARLYNSAALHILAKLYLFLFLTSDVGVSTIIITIAILLENKIQITKYTVKY